LPGFNGLLPASFDIAGMSTETKITEGIYSPLYVSREGDKVIIKTTDGIFRLGPIATSWLTEALRCVLNNIHDEEQALSHHGKVVLKVRSRFPLTYISGTNVNIFVSQAVLVKLVMWLLGQ